MSLHHNHFKDDSKLGFSVVPSEPTPLPPLGARHPPLVAFTCTPSVPKGVQA